MKRRIRLFAVSPGRDGELDTLYAVAHDETIWTCAAGVHVIGILWQQIDSLPDAPDDMRDQLVGATKQTIAKDTARAIFRDLGVGIDENKVVADGHDFGSFEAGFAIAVDTAIHRLGLDPLVGMKTAPPVGRSVFDDQ